MGRPRSGKSNRKVGRGARCAAESVVVTFRASGRFPPLTQAPKKIREKHRAEAEAYAASLQIEDGGFDSDSDSDYYS
jgi:hypothetical protein